jgi:hypothetical protein
MRLSYFHEKSCERCFVFLPWVGFKYNVVKVDVSYLFQRKSKKTIRRKHLSFFVDLRDKYDELN